MTRVIELWSTLKGAPGRPAFQRVDESHPWDLYALVDVGGEKGLMLLTVDDPPPFPRYEIIDLCQNRRDDGRWAIVVRLTRADLEGPFSRVCEDLIDASRVAPRGQHQVQFLLGRLARWHKLMATARKGLSEEEIRGLVGELLFLERVAGPVHGFTAAVSGWIGPLESPQDFELPGRLVEVKAVRPGASVVRISSLRQLDAEAVRLFVALVVISLGQTEEHASFSVKDLADSVRRRLETNPLVTDDFESRLAATGYSDEIDAAETRFLCHGIRLFAVKEEFPRLTRASVPPGIADASYEIQIAACETYLVPTDREEPE